MKTPPKGFEEITKNPDVAFVDVHPSPTAGGKFTGVDLPAHGGSDGRESKYVRCKQCGFIIDLTRFTPGSGWGNLEWTVIGTVAYDSTHIYDSRYIDYDGNEWGEGTSHAGCPLCGASEIE